MDYTVSYRFGRSDYVALLRAHRSLGLLGRIGRWGRYACYGLFFAVLTALVNILSWSFDPVVILGGSAIVFAVIFVVAPLGEFLGERLLALWMFPRLSEANKNCTLVFGEEGAYLKYDFKYGDFEGRVPWQSITRILEAKDYLFLAVSRAQMILVPMRALPSPAAAAELASYIRSKVDAAASGSAPSEHPAQ